MRMSWLIGRVAGIDLYLHPTFLILLAYSGATQGGLPAVVLISAAFGCVALHELGHALMARRFGIRTEDITLYPIGGVARLERLPKAPGAELLIALAGPAVNFAIAAALWPLIEPVGRSGAGASDFVASLAAINLGLGLFNLVPAFPMDGGRVLRALLSGWLGRGRATAVAAGLGRGLALAFAAYSLARGHFLQAALAGFIYLAAGAELGRVAAEDRHREGEDDSDWPDSPPGFRWVPRGDGVDRLAPIPITNRGGRR